MDEIAWKDDDDTSRLTNFPPLTHIRKVKQRKYVNVCSWLSTCTSDFTRSLGTIAENKNEVKLLSCSFN